MLIQTYTMFGKPARVFPFPPNWASPVNESLEWKTDVLRSFNGTEQRRSLRVKPRRGFEYSMLVQGEDTAMLEAYLWGWQHRHWALPVWTDRITLTGESPAGSTSLPINSDTYSFEDGGYALLYLDEKNYEVVEIVGNTGDDLILADETLNYWPPYTRLYPLILGHMNTSVQTTRHTGSVAQVASIAFNGSADSAYPFIPTGTPALMYDGIEVITHKPNWRDTINNEFVREFDIVDAGVGPVGYYNRESTSRIVRPFQWFLKTREQIVDFRKIMGRLQGQAKTCWIPSWHDDFQIVESNAFNQSILVVKGTWFKTFVDVDTSRDRLMVTLPNGNTVFRRITGISPNYAADTTQLQLDSTLGTTVGVNDNTRIRLLLRCRLATDKVVIPWRTDGVAEPQTTFTTVKL